MIREKAFVIIIIALIIAGSILNAQESTRIFENGGDKLIVYTDVPGLAPSEFYKIRVRSNATNNEWQESFALITRSLWSEQVGGQTERHKKAYFNHLKDWSHTYTNIEMKGAVEIELSRANEDSIHIAVVHPLAKGIATTIRDGKAYFAMEEPSLIAIDIDGQMDDQNTGAGYSGPPIHTVSVFATPIMDKPEQNGPGVKVVHPGEALPDQNTYETLYFGPGIHNIGREFTVQSFKKYYIPGDAFILGTFTNMEQDKGKNIKIYGVGTISGDSIPHPSFDPEYPGTETDPNIGTPWKPIGIKYSEYVEVEGVCCANPAFHAIYLAERLDGKHTSVKWAKVLQWRTNGDGIGNAHLTEDCFLRTQDDGCYIKGDKRRNVFWNDANCATFNLAGMPESSQYSLVIEDNDVLYARNLRGKPVGSRVFSFRAVSQRNNVNVTFNKLRIEDKFITLGVFHLFATANNACMENKDQTGGGINGNLTFKNIRAASRTTTGYPDVILGRESHLMSGFTFQNVIIDGKVIQNLEDIGCYNEYVTDMVFNPDGLSDDVTLSELKVRGEPVPDLSPEKEVFNIVLSPGTLNVPNVKTTTHHDGAGVETTHATAIPGSTTLKVTAANNVTTKTYIVYFTKSTDTLKVASVSINNCPTADIIVGEKHQLSTRVYPLGAGNRAVRWSSSDHSVAAIDEFSGLVTAISPGKAKITVTSTEGNFKDSCEINSVAETVSVHGVTISGCPSGTLIVDSTYQLTATVSPANAGDQRIIWSSSDEMVVSINGSGMISTHAAGSATLSATTQEGGFTDQCVLEVDYKTGSAEFENNFSNVKIYPNPVSDKLHVEFTEKDTNREIIIFNDVGQMVFNEYAGGRHTIIDINKLKASGLLAVQIKSGQHFSIHKVCIL